MITFITLLTLINLTYSQNCDIFGLGNRLTPNEFPGCSLLRSNQILNNTFMDLFKTYYNNNNGISVFEDFYMDNSVTCIEGSINGFLSINNPPSKTKQTIYASYTAPGFNGNGNVFKGKIYQIKNTFTNELFTSNNPLLSSDLFGIDDHPDLCRGTPGIYYCNCPENCITEKEIFSNFDNIVKLNNNNIFAVYSSEEKGIVGKILDKNLLQIGNEFIIEPQDHDNGDFGLGVSRGQLLKLSNGKILVMFNSQSGFDENVAPIVGKIYDGITPLTEFFRIARFGTHGRLFNVQASNNGKFISYYNVADETSGTDVVNIHDDNGRDVSQQNYLGIPSDQPTDAKILSNGKIIFIKSQIIGEHPIRKGHIVFAIIQNNDATIFKEEFEIMSNDTVTETFGGASIIPLDDKFVIIVNREDGNTNGIDIQLFLNDGTKIRDKLKLSIHGHYFTSTNYFTTKGVYKLNNGKFIIIWVDGDMFGQIFNEDLTKFGEEIVINVDIVNSIFVINLDDKFVIIWDAKAFDTHYLSGQIFNNDVTKFCDIFRIGSSESNTDASIFGLNDKFVIKWKERDGTGNTENKNKIFYPNEDTSSPDKCPHNVFSKDICCAEECGTCGGSGCSSRTDAGASDCCMTTIRETRNYCDESEPPCIIRETIPTPTPTNTTDPTCTNGIINDNVCCASTCINTAGQPQCGGSGCSLLPGGSLLCCMTTIRFAGVSCNDGVAPCVINQVEDADPSCKNGIRKNNVCCHSDCGTCGGSGCSRKTGGSSNCCTSTILSDNNLCEDQGAPCVMNDA